MLNYEQCSENVHFSFLPISESYLPNYRNWPPWKNFSFIQEPTIPQWGCTPKQDGPCPQGAHSLAGEAM